MLDEELREKINNLQSELNAELSEEENFIKSVDPELIKRGGELLKQYTETMYPEAFQNFKDRVKEQEDKFYIRSFKGFLIEDSSILAGSIPCRIEKRGDEYYFEAMYDADLSDIPSERTFLKESIEELYKKIVE